MNFLLLISICVAASFLQGASASTAKLAVVRAPSNLEIRNDPSGSKLSFDDLKRLLTSTLGFSIDSNVSWKGMINKNPLSVPNAIMIFYGDSDKVNMETFSTSSIPVDQQDKNIGHDSFDSLESIHEFNSKINKFDTVMSVPEKFPSDCRSQMNPEVYLFRIDDDIDSKTMTDAIDAIITKYQKDCSSDLLAFLLTHKNSETHKISKRQAKDNQGDDKKINNPSVFYSPNYPAMFNLLFWMSLLLFLAVFAIAYGMWNMDPGLDTVIYRMTSQRIKKDQ